MDPDSDTEIELAIDSTLDNVDADMEAVAPAAAEASTSPAKPEFVVPDAPHTVDDLSLIQEMVQRGDVVGSLPPIDMSAAEKRRLVEASMAKAKAQKAAAAASADPVPASTASPTDVHSDSSSEFESSSEEDSDVEKPSKPLTIEEHAALKSELDKFVGQDDSSSEEDSDDGTGGVLDRLGGFEFMEDSEEEVGDVGEAIMSTHEQQLPPVRQPPITRLPEEVQLIVAGDVVSWMKERAVENWVAKQAKDAEAESNEAKDVDAESKEVTGVEVAEGTEPEPTAETAPDQSTVESPSKAMPKFSSAGTVVIRAMQAPGQGWLEEGSVICFSDGRVLGTVGETFGPLTSPFYSIRLPPPPYPYPSSADLERGARVYFPSTPEYRKFVDMHAVRDPRFRSDASNVYDEEVGEDEMEWSDDEAEAAARRSRKQKKRGGSRAPTGGQGQTHHSLPARPHFDYAGDDDMGSLHGEEDWEGSDAGSTMSTASQRALVSYDDVTAPRERERRGRGRGRGQRGRGQSQGRASGPGRAHPLPPRPAAGWQAPDVHGMAQQQQQQQYQPYQPAGYSPAQPQLGMMPGMPMHMQQPQQYAYPDQNDNVPAINPRFAQMMNNMGGMGMPMGGMPMGGYWPQNQNQNQDGHGQSE